MANIYKNAKLDLTTNTVTTLYSVPSDSRAIIKSILVSDDTNNGSNITVDLFNGDPASGAAKFNLFLCQMTLITVVLLRLICLMAILHLLLNLICSRLKLLQVILQYN